MFVYFDTHTLHKIMENVKVITLDIHNMFSYI